MQKKEISVIIVHYKNLEILQACIDSLILNTRHFPYEVIIVNNSRDKHIDNKINCPGLYIRYYNSPRNVGYGAGVNAGSRLSNSKYLLILNSDTQFIDDSIWTLFKYIEGHPDVGIVAPTLLNQEHQPYLQIGVKELTPMRALFVLSFINKLIPNNKISRDYWNIGWKKISNEVDLVGGSALMMSNELFSELGGFDENFFLYFEEVDLCKRVKEQGYKIIMLRDATLIHLWKATTPESSKIAAIFKHSRFYYFRKHYGYLNAILVELVTRISKRGLMMVCFCVFVAIIIL